MNIEYLMWRDITITPADSRSEICVIRCGSIRCEKMKFDMTPGTEGSTFLNIQGYDGAQGVSNATHHSYGNPQLVKLNSQEIEFAAEGWSGNKKYKVSITAKF